MNIVSFVHQLTIFEIGLLISMFFVMEEIHLTQELSLRIVFVGNSFFLVLMIDRLCNKASFRIEHLKGTLF